MPLIPLRRGVRAAISSLAWTLSAALPLAAQDPLPTPAPATDTDTAAEPAAEPGGEPAAERGAEAGAEPTVHEQIEALRQQLLVLERKAEIAAEAEAEKAKTGATVTASARDGFSLRSHDGNFTLRLRGYVQADGRFYGGDAAAADTLLLRRVRPIFEGTIARRFGFRVMPDFGGGTSTLQDAYVDWTFSDAAVLRVGKLKPAVGLERLQSGTETAFVERALPTALVPNRDVGVQLGGALAGGKLEYQVGVFNGVVDGGSGDGDSNDGKEVAARLWATPWKGTPGPLAGLSFGVAATQGDQQGTLAAPGLPAIRTAGQQTFFSYRTANPATAAGTAIADGDRFRLAPQLAYFDGPLGLIGEYVTSQQEVRLGNALRELENEAWQVTAIWVVSGENASLRWYTPRAGFDRANHDAEPKARTSVAGSGPAGSATRPGNADERHRGRGGFALTARYNAFSAAAASFPTFAAATAVQEAAGWAIGFDWTLQRQTRLLVDYEVTSFDGLGAARDDEEVLFTRLQIGW
jgi:phosphate-selective porin OprO/OprP